MAHFYAPKYSIMQISFELLKADIYLSEYKKNLLEFVRRNSYSFSLELWELLLFMNKFMSIQEDMMNHTCKSAALAEVTRTFDIL